MPSTISDFHTHTFLSDGSMSPFELARRAIVNRYGVLAITDHVGPANLEHIVQTLARDCTLINESLNIRAISGVEITHVPSKLIDETARKAKELGAQIVVVHGETITEPVEPGTNLAALRSRHVDILAHPGLLTRREAEMAAEAGIFLELSSKRGHSLTNGHVARLALEAGASLVLDSDTHEPNDLLTDETAHRVVQGSGLQMDQIAVVLKHNPTALLKRLFPNQVGV